MRVWLLLIFLSLSAVVRAADDDKVAEGAALFESRCSGVCHQTPALDQLNAKQWRVVLNTMQQRMKQFGLAPLESGEYQMLLDYLTYQAK